MNVVRQSAIVILCSLTIPFFYYEYMIYLGSFSSIVSIITHLIYGVLPYLVFFWYFRKTHVEDGYSPDSIFLRIVIAYFVWSLALGFETTYWKLLDDKIIPLLAPKLNRHTPGYSIMWDGLLYLYCAVSLAGAVILSHLGCKLQQKQS